MENEAQRELQQFRANLADIKRDIERFENSERPFPETGLAAIRQRVQLAKDGYAEHQKRWTSHDVEKDLKDLESRLSNLEQE
jgi:CHASE3 domain sensor protein